MDDNRKTVERIVMRKWNGRFYPWMKLQDGAVLKPYIESGDIHGWVEAEPADIL